MELRRHVKWTKTVETDTRNSSKKKYVGQRSRVKVHHVQRCFYLYNACCTQWTSFMVKTSGKFTRKWNIGIALILPQLSNSRRADNKCRNYNETNINDMCEMKCMQAFHRLLKVKDIKEEHSFMPPNMHAARLCLLGIMTAVKWLCSALKEALTARESKRQIIIDPSNSTASYN